MIVNGTIVHNNNNNNNNTSWSSHCNNYSNNNNTLVLSRQWLLLLGIILILPMSFTYFHFHQLLRYEQCTIKRYQYNDNGNDNNKADIERKLDGIYCKGHGRNNIMEIQFVPLVHLFGSSATPPSIATFATTIQTLLQTSSYDPVSPLVLSDNNNKDENDPSTDVTLKLLHSQLFYLIPEEERKRTTTTTAADATTDTDTDTDVSSYGFRRNPNKYKSSSSITTIPTPITTYFWLFLNIALFVLYWNNRVTPSKVALNQKVFRDFGRAITGNLAHFEVWHVGMNMMTCSSVGELLEHPSSSIGTIPLMLWTWSFVAFTTICVILLDWLEQQIRIQLLRHRNTTTTRKRKPFPNMVGFSGILFCWSVYMTLSLEPHQQLCPIPILSTQLFCFETYELGNISGLKFNWGPIIQLVVLQVVLPRVSFIGHLSGILCGFGWYWNLFPSLELSQPALSFPVVWFVGKYYVYKRNHVDDTAADDVVEGSGGGGGGGHILGDGSSGGGYVLGSKNSSTDSNSSSSSNRNNNRFWSEDGNGGGVDDKQQQQQPQQFRQYSPQEILFRTVLRCVRNCLFFHFLWTTWVYRYQTPFHNSIILSELWMTLLFSIFVRAVTTNTTISTSSCASSAAEKNKKKKNIMTIATITTTSTTTTTKKNPFQSIGIVGRGYIAFVTIIFITDSMTIGGWFATRLLWQSLSLSSSSKNNDSGFLSSFLISLLSSSSSSSTEGWTMALLLYVTRFGLWIVSISIVCYILDRNNELQPCRSSTSNNTIAGIGVGIDNTNNDDDDDNDDGIWFHFFGLFLIHPCRSLGKTIIENRCSSSMINSITSQSSLSTAAAAAAVATIAAATNSNNNTDTGGGLITMTSAAADSRSVSIRQGRNRSNNSISISERRANILSSRGGGKIGHNSVATTTMAVTTMTTAVTKRGDGIDTGDSSPSSLSSIVTSTPSSMAAISNIV